MSKVVNNLPAPQVPDSGKDAYYCFYADAAKLAHDLIDKQVPDIDSDVTISLDTTDADGNAYQNVPILPDGRQLLNISFTKKMNLENELHRMMEYNVQVIVNAAQTISLQKNAPSGTWSVRAVGAPPDYIGDLEIF